MKILYYIILSIAFLNLGCEKFVEVELPVDKPTTKSLFETNETATSTITGLYAHMMRSDYYLPYYLPLYSGFYSDELDYNGNGTQLREAFQNNLDSETSPTNLFWTSSYNLIYQANSIINGVKVSETLSTAVKNQLLGEALFLRAFWHFYLTNYFGDVPLATTTDYLVNARISKSPSATVYNQIIKDLDSAKSLLTEKYVAGNSVAESTDRIRPNKFTVSALLARVFLFQKKYELAEREASLVIGSNLYSIESIDNVFKRTSKEAIWQLELPVATGTGNSYEGNYFYLSAAPSTTSQFRCSTISPLLSQQFPIGDQRLSKWTSIYKDTFVTPHIEYRFPHKYKNMSTTTIDEYTNVFRLAETYLIRAEARANMGKIADAINDNDHTRMRSGLPLLKDVNPGISKEQLLVEIASERQRELFCEWGLRWMDIKRSTQMATIVEDMAKRKSITWKRYMSSWPIPLNDIINNTNLIQNDGYQ